jgi:hypothetical protein
MRKLKTALLVIGFVALVVALSSIDRWIWQQAHPQAPAWTYWFSN